jgi:protein TonB
VVEGPGGSAEFGVQGRSGKTGLDPSIAAQSEGAPGGHSSARSSYQALLRSLIERHKEYPLFARRAGLEGTCVVRCVISRDGDLRRTELLKASGSTHLDGAALRAVTAVGRFPPVPQEVGGQEVTFEIPILFRLSEG